VAAALASLSTVCVAAPAAARSSNEPVGDPVPGPIMPGPRQVGLTVVTTAVTAPLKGITAPGHPDDLFVVDQVGVLWRLDISKGLPATPTPFLRTHGQLGPETATDERGFLGAAFSPDFLTDGLVYTDTSEPFVPGAADFKLRPSHDACLAGQPQTPDHIDVVREWHVIDPGLPTMHLDPNMTQGRKVLSAEHPQANHNAGDLAFGPDDGLLYITDGDGGGADDQNCQENFDGNPMFGHPEPGNGQALDTPLGKMLRIDPRASGGRPYTVPSEPLAASGALPEIFAYGLRNPFRFSFDKDNHELWIGDVGQNDVEEVDLGLRGLNYGWHAREGTFSFEPDGFQLKGARSDGFPFLDSPLSPPGPPDPVAQYDHDEGTAVIGGFVYRGTAMPALRGFYVFGDTSRRLDNRHGRLFAFDADHRSAATAGNEITELRDGPLDAQLIGFGQDSHGELYAMAFGSRALGDTGVVWKLSQTAP
jgi:hypothetical protein